MQTKLINTVHYIKTLLWLYQSTNNERYLIDADRLRFWIKDNYPVLPCSKDLEYPDQRG